MELGLYTQCRTCLKRLVCKSAKEKFDYDFADLECVDYVHDKENRINKLLKAEENLQKVTKHSKKKSV